MYDSRPPGEFSSEEIFSKNLTKTRGKKERRLFEGCASSKREKFAFDEDEFSLWYMQSLGVVSTADDFVGRGWEILLSEKLQQADWS